MFKKISGGNTPGPKHWLGGEDVKPPKAESWLWACSIGKATSQIRRFIRCVINTNALVILHRDLSLCL